MVLQLKGRGSIEGHGEADFILESLSVFREATT